MPQVPQIDSESATAGQVPISLHDAFPDAADNRAKAIELARRVESVHADKPDRPAGLADLLTEVRERTRVALRDRLLRRRFRLPDLTLLALAEEPLPGPGRTPPES